MGENGEVRVRKPLAALTTSEIEDIADQRVRAMVLEKLNGAEPKKVFATEGNVPCFEARNGRRIPIKRVRIKKATPTFTLGEGRSARHVASESNHHVEIYAEVNEHANEGKWAGEVVSMSEAYQRLKSGKPVVRRGFGQLAELKFSLAPGEVIECDDGNAGRQLLVVRSFSEFSSGVVQIGFVSATDARKKADIIKSQSFIRVVPNRLREWHARKVAVNPIGEVTEAHD
ncbi:MAG: hypothetical protein ACREIC_31605 [Limisphaerales bacterium]